MSSLKTAALKLAQENPEFREALKAELAAKTAGYQADMHRANPKVHLMPSNDESELALVLDGIPPVGECGL